MRRDLPSPVALLAFEASARNLSLKHAARELNVSPAAVSRQIRNLETYVGRPLFHRRHRRIELTDAGTQLFDPVTQGFAAMARTLAELRTGEDARQVTVGTTLGFAYYWLMPRLSRFSDAWPEIAINHVVADDVIDLTDGGADLAIRYGGGQWPGTDARYLFGDRIYPVCSPAYLETVDVPAGVADLAGHPLFDSRGIPGDQWVDWATWFRQTGHPMPGFRAQFLNYLIGVQMALDGKGFVLGWHSFVGDLVAQGRLVAPLDDEISSPGAFFLTMPAGQIPSQNARLFTDWLINEATMGGG